jgi:hypothetical protein
LKPGFVYNSSSLVGKSESEPINRVEDESGKPALVWNKSK